MQKIKDYVYIPLGGRGTKARAFFNLFAVWMLTEMWHGANWRGALFVVDTRLFILIFRGTVMERKIFQRCTVCIVTIMLFVFALSVAKSVFVKGIEKLNTNSIASHFPIPTVNIGWVKQYPFVNEVQDSEADSARQGIYAKIMTFMKDKMAYYSKKVFCYERFIEFAITAEKFLALPNVNDYTVLSGDYLVEHNYGTVDVTRHAESLKSFSHFLKNRNIDLLYVQIPDKICKEDEFILKRNMSNKNADKLLLALKQAGIPHLDLRQELHRQGLIHHDLFFKTDVHWKPEAGLWAVKIIAERLNSSFGFEIDTSLYAPERYISHIYDDFIGSTGNLATLAVLKPEPISFLFPKFDTDLTVRIPSRDVDERGAFDITYDQNFLERAKQISQVSENRPYYYIAYSYGIQPVIFMRNNDIQHNKKKILMIHDSFSYVVTPFLALGITEVQAMDIRNDMGNFSGSVQSFIEENSPNAVLILYCPGVIQSEEAFDFR